MRGRLGPDCDTLIEWIRDEEYPMEVSSWEMEKYLANPSLRTSVGSDWSHLTVRTRLEPASCRYLRIPATPDPWLVLTTAADRGRLRSGAEAAGTVRSAAPATWL